jgi:hypothetical protein
MMRTKILKIKTDDNSTSCSLPILSKIGVEEFSDYIIGHWVEKDGEKFWAPEVKKEAKVQLKRIFKLMSSYKLECLLETIIEIDELWGKLEE